MAATDMGGDIRELMRRREMVGGLGVEVYNGEE
jgi:hypothetical protein